jgi:hypothetical protein
MIFLRAFGLTRFAESQQTRRSSAPCARQGGSTRFHYAKVKLRGIWDIGHRLAWRLLQRLLRTCLFTRSFTPQNREGANERSRELMLATRCHADARKCAVHMAL